MKNLKENIKLGISEAVASLLGLLAVIFTFIPAYFEDGQEDMSIFQIMAGNERVDSSPLLVFGFVFLIIGVVIAIALTVLLFLNKSNNVITTCGAIASIVTILIGAVILTCSIFITGLDKIHSELGLVQGSWGFLAGNFLVPISALLSIVASYPSAMIILHHQDLKDKAAKSEQN